MCCNLPLPTQKMLSAIEEQESKSIRYMDERLKLEQAFKPGGFRYANKKIPKAEIKKFLQNKVHKEYCKNYSFEDKKAEDDTIFGFLLWLRFNSGAYNKFIKSLKQN